MGAEARRNSGGAGGRAAASNRVPWTPTVCGPRRVACGGAAPWGTICPRSACNGPCQGPRRSPTTEPTKCPTCVYNAGHGRRRAARRDPASRRRWGVQKAQGRPGSADLKMPPPPPRRTNLPVRKNSCRPEVAPKRPSAFLETCGAHTICSDATTCGDSMAAGAAGGDRARVGCIWR